MFEYPEDGGAIHKDEAVIVKKETVCNRIVTDPILRGRVKRLKKCKVKFGRSDRFMRLS